jgi:hypothetical protein
MASPDASGLETGTKGEYDKARSSKFRFKSKAKGERNDEEVRSHRSSKRRRAHSPSRRSSSHSRHKSRRKTHHDDPVDDPSLEDDAYIRNTKSSPFLAPEAAFRESLFDALADDEGAAFWEGVYGQPIHTYPNEKVGPEGKLEQMTEDEYTEYVRSKMWEKSHEHIVEERKRRENERQRKKRARKESRQYEYIFTEEDRAGFEEKITASLKRGSERKSQRKWQDAWEQYLNGWEKFKDVVTAKSNEEGTLAGKASRGIIPWPVESGRWKDVAKEGIEDFFKNAPPTDSELSATLKTERVRWHPDKMQQRFGKNKLDEETVKTITAVFQVVDHLWTETVGKKR